MAYEKDGEDEKAQWKWKISSGDTMSSIAKETGFSVNEVMAANPDIKDANVIGAGNAINIPQTERIKAFQWASQQVDSTAYAQSATKDNIGAGTYKCTKFTSDAYTKGAGVTDYPTVNAGFLGAKKIPVRANDLAGSSSLGPLVVTNNPKIGDIGAYGSNGGYGHAVIIGLGGSVISAGQHAVRNLSNSYMTTNGYSNPTFRTYGGK